jgi:hypothetical protein
MELATRSYVPEPKTSYAICVALNQDTRLRPAVSQIKPNTANSEFAILTHFSSLLFTGRAIARVRLLPRSR